ncbi:fatty acid desaturase [Streptomyces sp. AC627_RSS907]|uniref:fatty acid desaturase family protein n=1 Tax=Streptomyces sp. AC627_RSS907 TaxID=2823684 RepID=UPI001C260B2B|nr:fatty acid desaturase [Streptomyces sp. AC627_RSS907]
METRQPRVFRHGPVDAVLVLFSIAQFSVTIALAAAGPTGLWPWSGSFALVTFMVSYSVIIVSHLFVHKPWFVSSRLNAVMSLINSANIAQSVQAYHLSHVRNHHRYNNDRKGADGTTRDVTSTFRYSRDDGHAPLWRYLAFSLAGSVREFAGTIAALRRGCRVGADETLLQELATRNPGRRKAELRQVQADRLAHLALIALLAVLSWQWLLICYLPAIAVAFTLVNVQNYYRHYGAHPESRYANSVSHYGRLYNVLTFNDGYHQEHHLRPATHWSRLPRVAEQYEESFGAEGRVVSPVPAMVGFLDVHRVAGAPAFGPTAGEPEAR